MDLQWLLDYLLREGAGYAEVRSQRNVGMEVVLKNGVAEPPEYVEANGIAVRAIVDGALGFASTNILTREGMMEAGSKAVRSAKAMTSSCKKVCLSNEIAVKAEWKADYRTLPTSVEPSEVIDLLKSVDASIKEVKGAEFPNRLLVFGGSVEEKEYINSEGTKTRSMVPRIAGYFIITAYEGGKGSLQRIVQLGESGGWERAGAISPEVVAREEAEAMARMLREGKSLAPGKYDVVVGGEVTGIISHEACGHPQEADRIMGREAAQAGESYLKPGMLGRKIGSDAVNISDDPTLPASYGFYLYDDEGVPARRKALIREGKVNEFLHSRETAHDYGVSSNASMRASSYAREPIVRMSNTFMEPGDHKLEELVEGVERGVYIKSFQEWNIDDIRWNNRYVGLEAYMIDKGEVRDPVRAPVIEATTEVIFSSVDAVGRDLIFKAATCGKGQPEQGVPVWTGGPSMRLRGIYLRGR
ncbi:MAG: TldD/PmbA family protein [Candidatus Verstraetearchaeota archaeon]|nr:TldD/PmbA family protein [Candidatus Verstraetearchaeota archaeon]